MSVDCIPLSGACKYIWPERVKALVSSLSRLNRRHSPPFQNSQRIVAGANDGASGTPHLNADDFALSGGVQTARLISTAGRAWLLSKPSSSALSASAAGPKGWNPVVASAFSLVTGV